MARVLGSIEITGETLGEVVGRSASPGAGDLVVEGVVEGSVHVAGRLTLGPRARIDGEISARDVRIAGRLQRGVRASGVIHLLATAEVYGDLEAARVVIDDGALFEGQVRLRRDVPRAEGPARPAAPARVVPELSSPGRRRVQRRTS